MVKLLHGKGRCNLTIGERIKYYRIERGITQERLANELYISNQAVSKWERNASLPDISLIAKIAHVLGVSCDALFVDSLEDVDKELNEIIKKAEQVSVNNVDEYKCCVSLLEKTLEKYPKACALRLALAEVYLKGIDFLGCNDYSEKIIKHGEYVLSNSEEMSEVFRAIQLLCYTYRITGELDRARELAEQMPSLELCKEALLYHSLPKEEYKKGIASYILKLLDTAEAMLNVLIYPSDTKEIKEQIDKLKEIALSLQ